MQSSPAAAGCFAWVFPRSLTNCPHVFGFYYKIEEGEIGNPTGEDGKIR
ncbi:MAG: hypothetical protein OXN27_05900 [Candidatus Poribacteria bacterium]|nr:hypothetical protein [Candidatus Poribacteria bacterium]